MVNPNGSPDRKAENAEGIYADMFKGKSTEEILAMGEKIESKLVNVNTEQNSSNRGIIAESGKNNAESSILNSKLGKVALTAILAAGIGLGATADRKANSESEAANKEKILEVSDDNVATAEESPVSNFDAGVFYGDSNPYEVTIGSEREKAPEAHVDGYDQPGMWLSGDKERPFNFADASEVARLFNNSEKGMAKYAGVNQIEEQASYLHFMPDELKTEDLKKMNMLQAAEKLDELASDQSEEGQKKFAEANKAFIEAINHADVDHPVLNGYYYSAYIGYKDANGNILNRNQATELDGAEFTHDNMELMQSVVRMNNKEVTRFTFKDEQGNILKDEKGNPYTLTINATPIYDDNGKITGFEGCLQPLSQRKFENVKVVNQEGEEFVKIDTNNPPDNPTPIKPNPKPTPTPKPTPEPTPGYEWGKSGDPHGEAPGYTVEYSDPVDPGSLVTWDQNENTNNGNQGYVDDNSATPGSYSDNNGYAEVVAPGATETEERLSGGEVQGGVEINGANTAAPAGDASRDAAGNEAQKNSGGSHTDAQQEEAYEKGDF